MQWSFDTRKMVKCNDDTDDGADKNETGQKKVLRENYSEWDEWWRTGQKFDQAGYMRR